MNPGPWNRKQWHLMFRYNPWTMRYLLFHSLPSGYCCCDFFGCLHRSSGVEGNDRVESSCRICLLHIDNEVCLWGVRIDVSPAYAVQVIGDSCKPVGNVDTVSAPHDEFVYVACVFVRASRNVEDKTYCFWRWLANCREHLGH
jgi:hypothetical protein